jgi:hypothetical protein
MRSLTSAQRRVQCNFCRCTPDTVRLLQIGFLPASPIAPQTAFSLPLLIFHDSLWNNCHVGALPFTTTLKEWLEPRSERLFVRRKKHVSLLLPSRHGNRYFIDTLGVDVCRLESCESLFQLPWTFIAHSKTRQTNSSARSYNWVLKIYLH